MHVRGRNVGAEQGGIYPPSPTFMPLGSPLDGLGASNPGRAAAEGRDEDVEANTEDPGRHADADPDADSRGSHAEAAVPVRKGLPWMLLGASVAGAGAYLFQMLGARTLGDEAYAPIGVLWTLHYLLITIFLYGIETFVTREVALRPDRDRLPRSLLRKLSLLLAGATPLAALVAWASAGVLFPGVEVLALVVGAMVATHGMFFVFRGLLAGSSRFRGYGIVTGVESLSRLALAGVVALLLPTTVAFSWTIPAGGLVAASAWFFVSRTPLTDEEREARTAARREATGAGRFLLVTTSANAAAQLLLAGGPLALAIMGASARDISVFFVTITAARVPIVLAFGGVLSRVLPAFTARRAVGGPGALNAVALGIAGAAAGLGVIAGAAGAWLGPPIIGLLFGGDFTPSPLLAGGAGATVLLASGGLLLNQVLVAQRAERRQLAPWYAGLGTALVAIAVLSGPLIDRVTIAVVVGEAVAVAALLAASLHRDPVARGPAARRSATARTTSGDVR
jgi:O-antigen/teichoic acid export membrane protein